MAVLIFSWNAFWKCDVELIVVGISSYLEVLRNFFDEYLV